MCEEEPAFYFPPLLCNINSLSMVVNLNGIDYGLPNIPNVNSVII